MLAYRLLTLVQVRNFCLNKTTSERFAKAKIVQESRTSTYLESQGGQSFIEEDILSSSIVEAMQTRDHSDKNCTTIHNCGDMWCLKEHPDQAKIYQIQRNKHEQQLKKDDSLLPLLETDSGLGSRDKEHKTYNKTPKKQFRNGVKVAEEELEIREEPLEVS